MEQENWITHEWVSSKSSTLPKNMFQGIELLNLNLYKPDSFQNRNSLGSYSETKFMLFAFYSPNCCFTPFV